MRKLTILFCSKMSTQTPSQASVLIATALISLLTGYFLGLGSSIGFLPSPFTQTINTLAKGRVRSDLDEEESSSDEIDDDLILDNAPNWANGEEADKRQGLKFEGKEDNTGLRKRGKKEKKEKSEDEEVVVVKRERPEWESGKEECKLVLVVRTDLGMTKGKIAAQCGHATLACYKSLLASKSPVLKTWERLGQAKIAVQIKSEDELFELQARAMSLGITAEVIADAGRTQIESGSHTVLGIGPAPKSVVDAVTGHLKLL